MCQKIIHSLNALFIAMKFQFLRELPPTGRIIKFPSHRRNDCMRVILNKRFPRSTVEEAHVQQCGFVKSHDWSTVFSSFLASGRPSFLVVLPFMDFDGGVEHCSEPFPGSPSDKLRFRAISSQGSNSEISLA
jgi:hypothetical protein